MKFFLIRKTAEGKLVLRSDSREPVRKKLALYANGERIGFVTETIGRVDSPLYLAVTEENFDGNEKEFETNASTGKSRRSVSGLRKRQTKAR